MSESPKNEMACFDWSCGFCGTRDPLLHALDCKGLTPQMVTFRKALGQPWPTDQPACEHGDGD